jgi:hypothetical protein
MKNSFNPDSDSQNTNIQSDEPVFGWRAYNYHPHQRGPAWMILFCVIVFGSALALVFFSGQSDSENATSLFADMQTGNIFMAVTICLAAAVYFYIHRQGDQEHDITVYEYDMYIDNHRVPIKEITGFWFVYEDNVSLINIELQDKRYQKKRAISLQMGNHDPEFFQENFEKIGVEELFDKKESLIDKWIRVLKL